MSLKKLLKREKKTEKNRLLADGMYRDLINAESALGRTIFGPVPAGHQREFFAYRKNVWLWYEAWTDTRGRAESMTVRYEVRPDGVYKRPNNGAYEKLGAAELENFCAAVRSYYSLVKTRLYG